MTDIRRLFEQEMRSLLEEGVPFAAEFPEAARMLDQKSLDDRDPYVERILEGTAFLMARIRQEMESDGDPLAEQILEQIAPDLLQPLPSVAVVEFALRPEAAAGMSLPAETRILSEPLEGLASPLIFTLADSVVVHRAKVEAARVVQGEKGDGFLELELGWDELDPAPRWPSELDLYLHGDAPVVWAMRFALSRRTTTTQAWVDNSWQDASGIRFERLDRRSYNADSLPPSPFAQARDFLCADERFRFVRLVGLDTTGVSLPDSVKLRIHFEGVLPRGLAKSVRPDLFRLRAGVAINRYRESCEALAWDHTRPEMNLRPLGGAHREILDIASVRGVPAHGGGPSEIHHRHGAHRHHGTGAYFQLLRRRDANGDAVAKLAVGRSDLDDPLREQFLSIDGVCCDGATPHDRLRPDALSRVEIEGASRLLAGAITRPTPIHRPPDGAASRLLCFAAGHAKGWLDAARLRDGLRHCQWEQASGKQTLIESIQDVAVEHGHILICGVAWRQMRVSIRLRDTTCTPDTWDRLGQIDALGSVLWALVRDETPLGSKARLELRVDPAGVSLLWND
jgi:type VI secretion system protein ImpG